MTRIRKCSAVDCPETATITRIERFYFKGHRVSHMSALCAQHADKAKSWYVAPTHETEYREIKL